MYKGILLDIDNTLYNYEPLHQLAQRALFNFVSTTFKINLNVISVAYKQAKLQVKHNNPVSAASHNRLLYVQNLCEILGINAFENSILLYDTYWNTFLESLTLSNGAKAFLSSYGHLSICLLTDLTAHIQHRKVAKLELHKWANYMVTSEEAGCEKPHPFMFQLALKKLNLQASEVCMIGDSFKKDIEGANSLGIKSYWLTDSANHIEKDNIHCISNLGEIKW
jgi:HAD superfamily hydrolase (TIGR01549 family)